MRLKVKYSFKCMGLYVFIIMICFCNEFVPEDKRTIDGRITILNIPYRYRCNYQCTECFFRDFVMDGYQEHLLRECHREKIKQYNTITRTVKWFSACYGMNKWGDTIAIWKRGDPRYDACKIDRNEQDINIWDNGDGGDGSGGGNDGSNFNGEWVEFHPGNNMQYGFDSWRTPNNGAIEDNNQISYVSVKDGGASTFINIGVNVGQNLYDRFEARIINNGTGAVSFSQNTMDTALVLATGKIKTVEIFGHRDGEAEIEVWGVNIVRGSEARINRQASRTVDRLIVKVFREHVFADFNVYYVNDATFRPTKTQWRNGFNGILKQMVAELGNVNVRQSASGWDMNNNGRLDIIADFKLDDNAINKFNSDFPADRKWESEDYSLLVANRELEAALDSSRRIHVHFIVPGPIRMHYVVKELHRSGSLNSILELNTMMGLENVNGAIFRISKYYDPTDPGELIRIYTIIDASRRPAVRFEKLDGSTTLNNTNFARDNITIHRDDATNPTGVGRVRGFAMLNASFAVDAPDYNLHVHEFLHHEINNHYLHVQNMEQYPYSLNIMRPILSHSDKIELRYRLLRTETDSIYSQWSRIRRQSI